MRKGTPFWKVVNRLTFRLNKAEEELKILRKENREMKDLMVVVHQDGNPVCAVNMRDALDRRSKDMSIMTYDINKVLTVKVNGYDRRFQGVS
jgi:hypothetical protein